MPSDNLHSTSSKTKLNETTKATIVGVSLFLIFALIIGQVIRCQVMDNCWGFLNGLDNWKGWKAPSEVIRNLMALLAFPAIWLAWRRTNTATTQTDIANQQTKNAIRQSDIALQGQFADRYAKAAAMLSDKSLPVREAGIFALRELAIVDPNGHYFPVQDLLCSFMRDEGRKAIEEQETIKKQEKSGKEDLEPIPCKSDVIAALRALSDLRTEENLKREKERNWRPDLQKVNLAQIEEVEHIINLQRADLRQANLQNSYLLEPQLQDTNLSKAKMQSSELYFANLQGAKLSGAKLQDTCLINAKLQNVDLRKSNLTDAQLYGAQLDEANLVKATIGGIVLTNASLKEARFSPPIWPPENWPESLSPTSIKTGTDETFEEYEYFTFIPINENEEAPD